MAGLNVNIDSHTHGVTVGRWMGIWGGVSATVPPTATLDRVEIQLGAGGPWLLAASASPSAYWGWSWQGNLPNSVRPGTSFVVTVRAFGTRRWRDGEGQLDSEGLDGSVSLQLRLEDQTPRIRVDDFQPTVVTLRDTAQVSLSGDAWHTGDSRMYYTPAVQYRVGAGPFAPVPLAAGRWALQLTLPRGQHTVELTASDGFGSVDSSGPRSIKVLSYLDPTPVDPAGRTTAGGVPTTSSITSWNRIEPQVGGADIELSAAMRVFDPLWMLTRQWQMGEYQGEDAGTPVKARIRANSATLSRWHRGTLQSNSPGLPYSPTALPLEALIESMRIRAGNTSEPSTLQLAVDAGLHFLRLLNSDTKARKYAAAFRQRYAVEPLADDEVARLDASSRDLLGTLRGRALDARPLVAALRAAGATVPNIEPALAVTPADLPAVRAVASAWLLWNDTLLHEPVDDASSAWLPERLEYTASVAAGFGPAPGAGITLTATQHEGDHLDWYSFDSEASLKIDTQGSSAAAPIVQTTVPAPVHIHGTPAQRLWEFEDGHVAFGLVAAEPTDIAQLMLVEYTGSYGNDWYVVPVTLPVGSLTRVSSLVVTDTFGARSLVRPLGDPALPAPHFSLWQQSRRDGPGAAAAEKEANLFFLAPTVGTVLESKAVEEVHLVRDEMANVAWAIEVAVEGAAESAARVADLPGLPRDGQPGHGPGYRLWSSVPEHWVPVLPVRLGNASEGRARLKVGRTVNADGSIRPWCKRSRILDALRDKLLYEEDLVREGVQLSRRRSLARWIDGSTWLWASVRTEAGRDEQSASLRFDFVDEGK
jgi:hypothetical protein